MILAGRLVAEPMDVSLAGFLVALAVLVVFGVCVWRAGRPGPRRSGGRPVEPRLREGAERAASGDTFRISVTELDAVRVPVEQMTEEVDCDPPPPDAKSREQRSGEGMLRLGIPGK